MTTVIDPQRLAQITRLDKGGHDTPTDGLCFMEAVAYVRGVPHTDHPSCVAPVLGAFGRGLNDILPDDLRQELIPLIPLIPGTADDGRDETRSYLALDWLIRTWLPTWLDLVPACRDDATALRGLGRIVDMVSACAAGPVVRIGQEHATAAGDAAGDAARAALAPTVTELQRSAIELYTVMISPEVTR